MDKKDIYEHLAQIYLDASLKGKKSRRVKRRFRQPFFISMVASVSLVVMLFLFFLKQKPLGNSEVALVVNPELTRINFHFDPAKKEAYSIQLKNLDISRYKALAFDARRSQYNDNVALRVEFTNAFKEKSEVYFRDIPHKWMTYRLPLANFKKISDWSKMAELAFIIEEWNTKDKNGVVYIDNVRVLR